MKWQGWVNTESVRYFNQSTIDPQPIYHLIDAWATFGVILKVSDPTNQKNSKLPIKALTLVDFIDLIAFHFAQLDMASAEIFW